MRDVTETMTFTTEEFRRENIKRFSEKFPMLYRREDTTQKTR